LETYNKIGMIKKDYHGPYARMTRTNQEMVQIFFI
jgi:hypothetical protein